MTKLLGYNEEMFLDATAARELTVHTLLHLPQEACGVLLGTATAGGIRIEQFHPIRNVAPNPLHAFMLDPEPWIKFCLKADKLIGIAHSHPSSLPVPSQEDLYKLNAYGQLLNAYLICTPSESNTSIVIQSYRIVHPNHHPKPETVGNYSLTPTQLTLT